MVRDFDLIVMGSGAGGSAFAWACAAAGKRVLVIERGSPERSQQIPPLDEQAQLIDKRPYDDRSISVNDVSRRLYMGGVLGGGTAVFGAALLRPGIDDFHPGRRYAERLDRNLWDWPINYDNLAPYYTEAERLYRLSGYPNDDFTPLHAPCETASDRRIPLAPINERLMSANRAAGLRPFRLPLAIDDDRCLRCDSCAGFLCPYGARRSAAQILEEAGSSGNITVLTGMEVQELITDRSGKIGGVRTRERATGIEHEFRADGYALAAGAIGSAVIALKSRLEGSLVGRHYMMHYSPIAVGIFARPTGADGSFIKQVVFADYYFGTPDCPQKMGIVQSLPAPGPLMLRKSGLRGAPVALLNAVRRRLLPLAGIIEDLPNSENRVFIGADGGIAVRHEFSDYDRMRGAALGRAMRHIVRRAGAILVSSRSFPSVEHVAHQCGTLRFGHDPKTAVVDADCRWFGRSNLYVVDGSIFPTSLGVGPSLTIIANALRVARIALAAI